MTPPMTAQLDRHGRKGLWRRLRLRRADGVVYLDRWGIAHDKVGRILLHRMSAPDPGRALHDHPWGFISIILWGGYTEHRSDIRIASALASEHAAGRRMFPCEHIVMRRPGSVRRMRLDEAHTVVGLYRRTSWSLVIGGPRVRLWGFYPADDGWVTDAWYAISVEDDDSLATEVNR